MLATKSIKSIFVVLATLATQSAFADTFTLGSLGTSYTNTVTHTSNDSGTWTFTDDYSFIIGGLTNVTATALDNFSFFSDLHDTIGIDTFKIQLYSATGDLLYTYINKPSTDPLLSGEVSWDNVTPVAFNSLSAGTYTLKVTGQVLGATGSGGGSYTLTLATTAVPEPESYAMMLAGLGLFGFAARRKQKA